MVTVMRDGRGHGHRPLIPKAGYKGVDHAPRRLVSLDQSDLAHVAFGLNQSIAHRQVRLQALLLGPGFRPLL